MKGKRIYWKAYCGEDRIKAIAEIRKTVSKYGFILDYKRFSDVSISLSIEIKEKKINILYRQLNEYLKLEEFKELESKSSNECLVLLNVTFTKSTGDMKIKAPAIPG